MLYYNTYFCYLTISGYLRTIRPVRWHLGAAYSSKDLMLRAAPSHKYSLSKSKLIIKLQDETINLEFLPKLHMGFYLPDFI